MKPLGFTLIELMIVVAIIAIVAAIAIPNLLRLRMGANETSAVASCKTVNEAQYIYRRTDYDGDGVLEFAGALRGNNSLLEKTANAGDLALIDKSLALAEGQPNTVVNKAGYVFAILTSQAASAGVARSYYAANPTSGISMTMGHAVSAVADSWDITGRNTFITSHVGVTYQKDRGAADLLHVPVFDPDGTWALCE